MSDVMFKPIQVGQDVIEVIVENERHTLLNLIVDELNNDPRVLMASYKVEHPLIGPTKMIIRTKGQDPRKVLADVCDRIVKQVEIIKKKISQQI